MYQPKTEALRGQVGGMTSSLRSWNLKYDCFPEVAKWLAKIHIPYGLDIIEEMLQEAMEERSNNYWGYSPRSRSAIAKSHELWTRWRGLLADLSGDEFSGEW